MVLIVVHLRFPGGTNSLTWTETLLFDKIFVENCMKMKEICLREEHTFLAPPWINKCLERPKHSFTVKNIKNIKE